MAGKLQPEYSGNPGNNKYKGIMDKQRNPTIKHRSTQPTLLGIKMNQKSEILNYVQERYVEEQARFKHFEDKASKLINSLTIVIGAFCGITGFKSSTLFSPSTAFEWIILSLCCLAFFYLSCAWGHSLLSLKIDECPVAPKSKVNAEYLIHSEDDKAFRHIFDCYVDATQELEKVIKKKSKNLKLSYDELAIGATLVFVFTSLTLLMEVIK
jgi:hypothetical protein